MNNFTPAAKLAKMPEMLKSINEVDDQAFYFEGHLFLGKASVNHAEAMAARLESQGFEVEFCSGRISPIPRVREPWDLGVVLAKS
jgi:hypothetical protein